MPEQISSAPASRAKGRYVHWFALALLVIILDQWAKYAVLSHFTRDETLPVTWFFNLTLAYNQGAAFGMLNEAGGWQRWLFAAIGVGASVWITLMLRSHAGKKLFSLALALIMGGALGNVVDRFAHDGHVVDFLDFHWGMHHFAVFNLADAAITCGAALLLLESFIDNRRARHARPASPGDESGK